MTQFYFSPAIEEVHQFTLQPHDLSKSAERIKPLNFSGLCFVVSEPITEGGRNSGRARFSCYGYRANVKRYALEIWLNFKNYFD